jgi:serine/threonine protein kinase
MDLLENELRGYIEDNGKPMWATHNNHNIRYFKEEDIRIITNNYDTLLGKGAFGEVYKGVLDDNSSVAVKRYIHNVKESFAKEMIIHCHINHRNVVRLIGVRVNRNSTTLCTHVRC